MRESDTETLAMQLCVRLEAKWCRIDTTANCMRLDTTANCMRLATKVHAWKSYTTAFVPSHKPGPGMQPFLCIRRFLCTICGVKQAGGTIAHGFSICTVCFHACQSKIRASVPDPDLELSFLQLQYDPGDVSFVVKGSAERIHAHRFILESESAVFKIMMDIEMREKLTGVIQIEGTSVAVVRAAMKFLYTGEIGFSDEVLLEDIHSFAHQYDIRCLKDLCDVEFVKKVHVLPHVLLSFAHEYDMQWLKHLCEVELVKKLTTENVLEMLVSSDQVRADLLKAKAILLFRSILDSSFKKLNSRVRTNTKLNSTRKHKQVSCRGLCGIHFRALARLLPRLLIVWAWKTLLSIRLELCLTL